MEWTNRDTLVLCAVVLLWTGLMQYVACSAAALDARDAAVSDAEFQRKLADRYLERAQTCEASRCLCRPERGHQP